MKITRSGSLVMAAALSFAACSFTPIASGQEFSDVPLNEQMRQLDLVWRAGAGRREYEYYVGAGKIADALHVHDPAESTAAAVRLLSSILEKRTKSPEVREADFEVGAQDLFAMTKLARFLLAQGGGSTEREKKIAILAKLLGHIRAEIIPGYAFTEVFRNVAPPAGVPGVAGMKPEAIADPEARQKYKAAIRENELNNLLNKRQPNLKQMEEEFATPIVEYISRAAASGSMPSTIIGRAVTDARLTDAEKAVVMSSLRR